MDFIQEITSQEGQVYLVGGSVRDSLLNRKNDDIDLLVRLMDIDVLESILIKYGKIKEAGKSFGIIIFRTKEYEFDIALPRTEVSTGPGYKDFNVVADKNISLETDLERRDATINAMAIRVHSLKDLIEGLLNDNIIDPFNGLQDIKNKIWRAVGDPYKRFLEDPTRILRALRQASQFDLEIEPLTKQAIIDHADLLKVLIGNSSVRLAEELVKLVKADHSVKWIDFIVNESPVGKIIDFGRSKNIKEIMQRAIDRNLSVDERIFILLHQTIGSHDKICEWMLKFSLSAAPSFPSKMTKFIELASQNYNSVFVTTDDCEMRWLIIKMKSAEFAKKLLNVFSVIDDPDDKCSFVELFEKNKDTIISVDELKISGIDLMELYFFSGKEVGHMKKLIFNRIIEGKLSNDREEIIQFLNLSFTLTKK